MSEHFVSAQHKGSANAHALLIVQRRHTQQTFALYLLAHVRRLRQLVFDLAHFTAHLPEQLANVVRQRVVVIAGARTP